MKKMNTALALLLALLVGISATATHAAEQPITAAVLDFKTAGTIPAEMGAQGATLLSAMLSAEGGLILVERSELNALMSEQELGLSGTVDSVSAAKVGQLTGAKVLVSGRVFRVGKELFMVAKVMGTETSRVYGAIAKGGADAVISDLAAQLASKIGELLRGKGTTLLAQIMSPEDRLAKIKAALGGGKLPNISVKIPEVHFGTPAVDPAAETEIGLIARQCGFPVVDEKSREKARYEIIGEAFSERGIRLGNLISCKARVEIKIRDLKTGKFAVIERQTTVAVDLSEHIAAKNALQDAGAKLAGRILPLLGE